jgi:hypothetical protein
MQRQRVPDIWKQVAAIGGRDEVARDFLIGVMFAEVSDPNQNLVRFRGIYEKRLEDTMKKFGRKQ